MSEAALEVVDLGNFPVDEATPVVAGPRGQDGADGASAYEVAVANGFVGTEAEWLASLGGGPGGGAVDSVNGQVGVVVIDAADVGAETPAGAQAKVDTHAADTTGVHGIADTAALATTADVSTASTVDRARDNHTGTQSSATISDFTEAVQDAVAALLSSGTNVTLTYDDPGNTLTVSAAGADAETMRDTIGAALVGVGNVAVTVNDAADTITISTTATVNSTDAVLRDRSTHTGTQAASTITGLGTAATKDTGTASGNVPLLSTGGRLPIAQIASGTPDGTKFVRDDGTLATPAGGGGGSALLLNFGASVPGGTAAGTQVFEKMPGLPGAIIARAPLAYYRLGESAGTTMTDASRNGRNGSYIGSPTLGAASLLTGDSDTAVTFNGSSQRGSVAYNAAWMNPGDFSLFAVIKPVGVSGNQAIMDRRDGTGLINQSWEFRLNANKLELLLGVGTSAFPVTGATVLSAGTKYNVGASKINGLYKVYLNGVPDGAGTTGQYNLSLSSFNVGASGSTGALLEFFGGTLDELAFFDRGLTDAEQAALHAAATTAPPTTGLVPTLNRGYWAG